jgi:hypothetical protein
VDRCLGQAANNGALVLGRGVAGRRHGCGCG